MPRHFSSEFLESSGINAVYLVNGHVEQIHQTVYTRGLYTAAKKYDDAVKPVEVAWVQLYE